MPSYHEHVRDLEGVLSADQEQAVQRSIAHLKGVVEQDSAGRAGPETRSSSSAMAARFPPWATLSARSVLVLGARGSGKTSVLKTIAQRLGGPQNEASHPFLPLHPLIDARALDRSDRILSVILEQLRRCHQDLFGDENPELLKKEDSAWRTIQKAALRTQLLYSQFVASTSASEAEFTDFMVRQTSGTYGFTESFSERLDALRRTAARGGSNPIVILFLDDLDLSLGRAYEAILDIDRYLSVPGLAFVFSAKYTTLFQDIYIGLSKGHQMPDEAFDRFHSVSNSVQLWQKETRAFMLKMFPSDCRSDLREWPVEMRQMFKVGEHTLEMLMDKCLTIGEPRQGYHADNFFKINKYHMSILPESPRQLRALYGLLGKIAHTKLIQPSSFRSLNATYRLLLVIEALALAIDEPLAIWHLSALVPVVESSIPQERSTWMDPEEIEAGEEHLNGVIAANFWKHLREGPKKSELPERYSPLSSDIVLGEVEVIPILKEIERDNPSGFSARWQEMMYDLVMWLEPSYSYRVMERNFGIQGIDHIGHFLVDSDITLVNEMLEAGFQGLIGPWRSEVEEGTSLRLTQFLKAYPGGIPRSLRVQYHYIAAFNDYWNNNKENCLWSRKPAISASIDDYRRILDNLLAVHIYCCYRAHKIVDPYPSRFEIEGPLSLIELGQQLINNTRGLQTLGIYRLGSATYEIRDIMLSDWFRNQTLPGVYETWDKLWTIMSNS